MDTGDSLLVGQLRKGVYKTNDGDVAATLMALGCAPLQDEECEVVYTEARPYRDGERPDHDQVYFQTEVESAFPGADSYHCRRGFDDDGAIAGELDDFIASIPDEELRRSIQSRLPQVIASFCRAALGNRRKVATWWRGAPEYIFIRRGKKSFLINRKAKELPKKWGL